MPIAQFFGAFQTRQFDLLKILTRLKMVVVKYEQLLCNIACNIHAAPNRMLDVIRDCRNEHT